MDKDKEALVALAIAKWMVVALLIGAGIFTLLSSEETPELSLEIATTEEEKAKGLSDRAFLPEGHGMLFVWQEVDQRCMWGKDLRFDVDLLFLNGVGLLVHKEPLDAGDPTPHCHEAQYVLEVNRGESV